MIAAALVSALTVCEPGAVTRTPVEAVDAFVAAYNARELEAVGAVLAPQARVFDGQGDLTGAQVIANYRTRIFVIEPPYVMRPLQRLAAGDMVAQTEAYTGGELGTFDGLTVYRVEGGCIVEMSVNR
jgi:hypothetical protein